MRHGNRNNSLSRTASHRDAMLSNMACSLIEHKRITTTLAKAKSLRKYVEPLITKSKTDSTHSRRLVFSDLRNKEAVTELFRDVAPKVADRNGGYTRIIKLGTRKGDAAEMCIIELVDFNEVMLKEAKTKTRRSRRGGGRKKSDTTTATAATETSAVTETEEEVKTETPKAEAKTEEPTKEEEKQAESEGETKDDEAASEDEKEKE